MASYFTFYFFKWKNFCEQASKNELSEVAGNDDSLIFILGRPLKQRIGYLVIPPKKTSVNYSFKMNLFNYNCRHRNHRKQVR